MKIVIVDDEQIILSWLKKMLESISSDYQVVKSCLNGYEAMEYCLNHEVNVLFTDISMPVLDGLGLVAELKKRNKMPYTVILTAYDDFSYAREALKLGAREYLLKTEITEQSLAECISVARKHAQANNISTLDELSEALTEFIIADGEVEDIKLQKCWKQQVGDGVTIFMIQGVDKMQIHQCKEMLAYVYAEEKIVYYTIASGETGIVIFSENPKDIGEFYQKSKNMLQSFGMVTCYLAIRSTPQVKEIKNSWKALKIELDYQKFYQLWENNISHEGQKEYLVDKETEITQLIEIEDYANMMLAISTWLDRVWEVKPPLEMVRRSALQFLLLLYWDKLTEEQCKRISVEAITTIVQATDFSSFRRLLLERFKQLLIMLQENEIKSYSAAVIKAMLFIKKNYQEPLTLEEVSNTVHLNRSYLSTLFKKETGLNLMDYLQRCRIEEAKKLLEKKHLNIQQICEQVGIVDATYFAKLFKKHVGKTPLEYRKTF